MGGTECCGVVWKGGWDGMLWCGRGGWVGHWTMKVVWLGLEVLKKRVTN